MKTWKKIALGVIALGIVGKLAGVEEQPQENKREVVTVEQPQQQQEESREEVLNNALKENVANYKEYQYMRSEHFANATNLAQAQKYRGKWQVNHMKLVGVKGNLVALQSEDGCNMILTLPQDEDKRDAVLLPLGWVDEPLVFVTITKLGRADDGKFIYMGTIEGVGAKTKNIGGIE